MKSVTTRSKQWKKRLVTGLLWFLAVAIALMSAVFQRRTGPTYPLRGTLNIEGSPVTYSLLRSETVSKDVLISIHVPDRHISGSVKFRRFRSYDPWSVKSMDRKGNTLTTSLPHQPPAGKLMYFVLLTKNGHTISLTADEPVILRYKGTIPATFLIPHVLFMFLAMIISNRTAIEVLFRRKREYNLMLVTMTLFFAGGLILGPVVQKYAFGEFWTGFPFGYDLTDNKTIVAFFAWIVAWIMNVKNRNKPGWILAASMIMLVIYLVPHSLLGSELDYTRMPPPQH